MVTRGYVRGYDTALQLMRELPYGWWPGLRHGGHGALLCPASTRGRHDPVDAAEDHRAEHRFAIPQRAEEGAEGMRITLAACAVWTVVLAASIPSAHAHWPGQPPHQMAQLGELQLEGGGIIHNFTMSYVTHGKLNAAKDNAIL